MNRIRVFLLVEAVSFAIASMIHAGRLVQGYEHSKARIAEAAIATVLVVGLALTWIRPMELGTIGLWAQGFALLGTLVGIFTIAVGVGPRTTPDIVYHVAIVLVLIVGLRVAVRSKDRGAR
jgi:predicted tellurium resistance membrane protein TerC